MVGISRCDVPARVQRAERMRPAIRTSSGLCAADGAALHLNQTVVVPERIQHGLPTELQLPLPEDAQNRW